jgi:hypothetical protein
VVEFTDWDGGFTDVSFLNTLTVDFEGAAEVNELVIYYPDTPPPLSTVEGVTITDLWPDFAASRPSQYPPGFPSSYVVDTFQGVNTIGAPDTDDYQGPYWGFSDLDDAVDVGSGPFTFEFWWRLGTSLPISDNPTRSAFVQVEFGDGLSNTGGVYVILQYEGGSGVFYSPPNIRINAGDGEERIVDNIATYDWIFTEDVISSGDATSFNHLTVQRHNATDYTVHYKGAVLQSWTMPSISYSDLPIIISPAALNVPGTAISQIRLSKGALYGTGNFTPPSTAFFTPPS